MFSLGQLGWLGWATAVSGVEGAMPPPKAGTRSEGRGRSKALGEIRLDISLHK